MKSNFKVLVFPVLLGALVWTGCQTQYPTSYVPSGGSNPNPMIMDFEGSGAGVTTVNAYLAEANRIGYHVQKPGTLSLNGGASFLLGTPGAANTGHCFRAAGFLTGTTLQLIINLDINVINNKWYYDASFFKGIQFYILTSPADSTIGKTFFITTGQTIPTTSQGECNPSLHCYDHFGYAYSGTGGEWRLLSIDFSAFKQQGWGTSAVPSTLSGTNLQQFMSLVWQESSNGGSTYADFILDEIQFY
jgi:hypothetical protein